MNVIGIDLGGTWIKGVLMDAQSGEIIKQLYHPTNGEKGWKQAVAETVADLKAAAPSVVNYVGLSAPGLPNESNQFIAFMPVRLQGLEGFHWGHFLNMPVRVINDAHAALLAETRFGVAKGYKNVLMLTLGTGVGGGILLNGQLYQGLHQKAGHMGHITVDALGQPDIMGLPGSLEDAIGNATVERRSLGRFTSTYQLLEAHKQGDYFAQWLWLDSVRKLAVGLCSLINTLSPELVVLGGGITQAEDDLMLPLTEFMTLYEWRPGGHATPIKIAQFGDMAGAIGAAGSAV